MARAHAAGAVIEEAADQESLRFGPCGLMVVDLFIELALDCFKEILIENGRLLTFGGALHQSRRPAQIVH